MLRVYTLVFAATLLGAALAQESTPDNSTTAVSPESAPSPNTGDTSDDSSAPTSADASAPASDTPADDTQPSDDQEDSAVQPVPPYSPGPYGAEPAGAPDDDASNSTDSDWTNPNGRVPTMPLPTTPSLLQGPFFTDGLANPYIGRRIVRQPFTGNFFAPVRRGRNFFGGFNGVGAHIRPTVSSNIGVTFNPGSSPDADQRRGRNGYAFPLHVL
ncbi:unnamed protein product (mitochondrion) [Plasmodiophora brassicae]|uniref:RxLR effector candidate protein n=1 Tax=Plasmodiophora brassicae TaxID=37360 RepID=A0A0G4J889_PLABS|nr:hypothetical protein PBRA_009391 [Plasmodiophora brassicae]SPQ96546.1 unnamed protein product [Plasmodiophora brassicae]